MEKKYLFKRVYLCIIVLFMCLLSLHCSRSPMSSSGNGTGTIIGNGIICATLLTGNGEPLQSASVRVRNFDYITEDSRGINHTTRIDTSTDMDGRFSIVVPDTGLFCIEVVKDDTLGKLLLCSLNAHTPYKVFDTLKAMPYGKINGRVDGSDTFHKYSIKVYGLERRVLFNADGTYVVHLPNGSYNIVVQNNENKEITVELDNIEVTSNQTVTHDIMLPEPCIPCSSYGCDSLVIVNLLETNNLSNLSINEIAETTNGRITELEFSNVVIDSIIDEIGKLDQLHCLEFEKCHITYISSNIGKLTNITTLEFKDCGLNSLPPQIAKLENIKECNLSGNKLCSLPYKIKVWADIVDPDWESNQICQ